MTDWINNAFFYHIYPLGFGGAPAENDFQSPPVNRLQKVSQWIPHLKSLGVNALYLGPLFESGRHGYDTANYYEVDRRLGSNRDLADLSWALHENGIRLVLDGVFNHVGRDFWAFHDLQTHQQASDYKDWFAGLDFSRGNSFGDPFSYSCWDGHESLVKLNVNHPEVRQHLFDAVQMWIGEWGIDGLRLDAADVIDKDFLQELAAHCKQLKPDFWLMGEVVHGNYADWANPHILDSVTNYESYKGLYSSFNDRNFFEIAWSLNRQFGQNGLYRDLLLYNFTDNHDVNRIASQLDNPKHLYPLQILLFSMPGIPSVYYGSEWGIQGRRKNGSDAELRPNIDLAQMQANPPQPELPGTIRRLAGIRAESISLRLGDYRQLHVSHQQLAFARSWSDDLVVVLVNASDDQENVRLVIPEAGDAEFVDLLNPGMQFRSVKDALNVSLDPNWGRILRRLS